MNAIYTVVTPARYDLFGRHIEEWTEVEGIYAEVVGR